uniref:Uncharacterized protein n=1 Tax=Siphoviridae sp. ctoiW10 TaxID=2827592 RepID=A0A8S5LPN7_9CAUD|nr:MAG TPA: hypothetical protein [Siphoviridae sp. ctoiW10]
MAQRSLPLRPPPETWGTPPSPYPLWHKGRGLRPPPLETLSHRTGRGRGGHG